MDGRAPKSGWPLPQPGQNCPAGRDRDAMRSGRRKSSAGAMRAAKTLVQAKLFAWMLKARRLIGKMASAVSRGRARTRTGGIISIECRANKCAKSYVQGDRLWR